MKNLEQVRPSILLRQTEGFYTITELAAELGVVPSTVWTWVEVGTIPRPTQKWRHHTRRYYSKTEYQNILRFLRGEK